MTELISLNETECAVHTSCQFFFVYIRTNKIFFCFIINVFFYSYAIFDFMDFSHLISFLSKKGINIIMLPKILFILSNENAYC